MTISPPSGSDAGSSSDGAGSFALLHPAVQQWIWDQEWPELRDAQERSIPVLLAGDRDLVIAASTAAGKTEAAFLPIISRIAAAPGGSVHALYVSPLKALINDQFRRLDELCERLEIPVHRWHGDVPANRKRALLDKPRGILLITPESLEALFVNHGYRLAGLFSALQFAVVDELHAFIGSERRRQLQSQLHRLELLLGRRVPRVGLSATLGDMRLACDALRPGAGDEVALVESKGGGQELRLQVRGYTFNEPSPRTETDDERFVDPDTGSARLDGASGSSDGIFSIAEHLFITLRGSNNLVFTNARQTVEILADRLARVAERERVPNEFLAHHGSLSKELREEVESRLKARDGAFSAVCTSTLELGIDIGAVHSVAQVGPPHSVAALRQRLGRSGRRRATPAVLRMYVLEKQTDARADPVDALHIPLVQATAMVRLLVDGWCEPPDGTALHLSTLVQQVLSFVAQVGGASAKQVFSALCDSGPFADMDTRDFAQFLRGIARRGLLRQDSDGTLLLDEKGERIVNHYSFYASFQSPDEFRVLHGAHLIGMIQPDHSLVPGVYLILGGCRWRVLEADIEERVVQVAPAGGARVPPFESAGYGRIHDRVRAEMRTVWQEGHEPAFLDRPARDLLSEARATFVRLGLHERSTCTVGETTILFVCRGDRIMQTIELLLIGRGLDVTPRGPVLLIEAEEQKVRHHLESLLREAPVDPVGLAKTVTNLRLEKFDWAVDEDLLARDYAVRMFDVEGANAAARELIESWGVAHPGE